MSDERDTPGLDDDSLEDLLRAGFADEPGEATPRRRGPTLDAERYREFELIGTGGMGVVFRALDTEMNRPVALKVVRPPASGSGRTEETATPFEIVPPSEDDAGVKAYVELTNRFLQEAWLTGALEHPGIVPVYEVGTTPRGVPYYTMRYVKGVRTLETALGEAKTLEERMELLGPFLHVCDAIRYAQSRGVLHRDLKPANLGIGEFGEVFVLDWGLAKMRNEPDVADSVWQERIREFRDTRDMKTLATALGTPGYMSPEAALGDLHRIDERSDVYSLGSVLYRILTGRLPYEFETYPELLHRMREGPPAPAASVEPAVSVELSEICAKALATAKEDRYSGAGPLADAIRDHRRESRIRSEIRGCLKEAGAALETAEALAGERRLEQLDVVRSLCRRVLEIRADHARARRMLADADQLRKRTEEEREAALREEAERARLESVERERARNRRLLRLGAAAALMLFAIGAATAAWVFDGQRRDAEASEREKTELLAMLGVTKQDRNRAREEVDALVAAREDGGVDLENARAGIEARNRDLERTRVDLERAEKDRDKAKEEVLKLKPLLQNRKGELDAALKQVEDLELRRRELEDEIASGTGDRGKLVRIAEERAEEIRTQKDEITKLGEELQALKDQLDARKAADAASAPGPITEREKWIQGTVRDIEALAEKPGASAVSDLVRFAQDRESPDEFRIAATKALGRRADDRSVTALLGLLDYWEGSGRAYIRILEALSETRDLRAVSAIDALLRRGTGTPALRSRKFWVTAIQGLGCIRTRESLRSLLDLNDRCNGETGWQQTHVHVLRALTELTGLPFEWGVSWIRWRRHAEETWRPTAPEVVADVEEHRSEGWRFVLPRPDGEGWEFDRPEGAVVRVRWKDATSPDDEAWIEVRACAATEAFPRGPDEPGKVWEKRFVADAVEEARLRFPEHLRNAEGVLRPVPTALAGQPAIRLEAEDPELGTWIVQVVERHELIYTVTIHHGPAAPPEVSKALERMRTTFDLLDRR